MKKHTLKSWPEFFADVARGDKMFELRRDDRHFEVGDILVLHEWAPNSADRSQGHYTGREVTRRVTYVMRGAGIGCVEPLKGLAIGYCILGLERAEERDFAEAETTEGA